MNRNEFKQRMKSLKSYREQNPDKGYWDWRIEQFQDGGENDNLPKMKEIVQYQDNARVGAATQVPEMPTNIMPVEDYLSAGVLDFAPIIGDAVEVANIAHDVKEGNYKDVAIGLGLLAIPGAAASRIVRKTELEKALNLTKEEFQRVYPGASYDYYKILYSRKPNEAERRFSERYGYQRELLDNQQVRQAKEDLKTLFGSKLYKDRLRNLNLSTEEIDFVNKSLQDRINDVNVYLAEYPSDGSAGRYFNNRVELRPAYSQHYGITHHELAHASTNGGVDIHPTIQKNNNYFKPSINENKLPSGAIAGRSYRDYYSDVDEIRARALGALQEQNRTGLSFDKLLDLAQHDPSKLENGADLYELATIYDRNSILKYLKYFAALTGVSYLSNRQQAESYKEGGEVPPSDYQGSNEPVNVNPFTKKPLANGSITPVLDLEDASNFTPIGDILSIRDAYVAAKNKDLIGLGLAGLGIAPFIPTVNRKATQDLIDAAIKQSEKSKQVVDDFYTQRNNVYESMIENEDAFKRAAEADRLAGTNYVGTYGQAIRDYLRNPSQYNDDLPTMRFDRDLYGTNIKMQVDPSRPGYITVNPRYKDPDELDDNFKRINPGLVRHEMGHQTDLKAGLQYTDRLADPKKFVSDDKLKEMFPKSYNRFKSTVLNKGSEIKSYMNEFREFLMDRRRWEPKETVKSFRKKLDDYSKEFPTLRMIFDSYKSKSDFIKDYNMVPLTVTNEQENLV